MDNSFIMMYPLLLMALWIIGIVFLFYLGIQVLRLLAKLRVYVQLLIDKEQRDFR